MLIETYRAIGNDARMRDEIDRFVQRFPEDPRTG